MKIGIFTDTYTPDINGVVSSIVTLQKGLEDAGHDVYIITGQKGTLHASIDGKILRMPGLELKQLYGYTLSTPFNFTVKSEIEKLNLDIIHVQQEFTVGMFGRFLARYLRIPMVYTYHTMYEDYTHYLNKFDLNSVDKISKQAVYSLSKYLCNSVSGIIAPSSKTKERLEQYGVTRPIYIIPTGLELDRFKKENISLEKAEEIKKTYNIDENTKLITYLGRIAAEKSIDMVIDGAMHIKDQNTKFMIVGGGPSLEDLKAQAKRNGIEDKVIFTGAVAREDVPIYYSISDVFVSASTSETQGITYIEALASGLCVFARRDEVLENLIEDGKNGFYFDSAEEFASRVEEYMRMDEKTHAEIKEHALYTASLYDVKKFVRDMLTVYETAISDYEYCYTIDRIVASNDGMKLYLHNEKHKMDDTLLISLDDYTLYRLKKDDVIEIYVYEALKRKENVLLAKRWCIKKLCAKDYTRKEMYDFLINQEKYELTIREINEIIEDLEAKGFINDDSYMALQIQKLDSALIGKKQILKYLVQKGLPQEKVEAHLTMLDEDNERIKCEKRAAKYMVGIKNKSIRHKKDAMMTKLRRDGFSHDLASSVVNELNFEEDYLVERVNLFKTVEKARKNYIKKWEGKELRDRIVRYALNKGFLYDDIVHTFEEKEWDDEQEN